MGKSNAPDAPDYSGLASQQQQNNMQMALWNNQLGKVNTQGPTGSTYWNGNTLVTSPNESSAHNIRNLESLGLQAGQLYQGALQRAGQPVDFSGIPGQQFNIDSAVGDNARKAAVDAVYGQYTANLDPQFQRAETDLETKLVNQGFDPNSDAYKEQMASFSRNKAGAYQQAQNAAVQQGQSAQDQAYRQALGNAQLNNTSRATAIDEMLRQHSTNQGDVNFLSQLMRGGIFMPQQASGTQGNASPVDYLNAANQGYQARLNATNVANANNANTWGTIGNLGALAGAYFFS